MLALFHAKFSCILSISNPVFRWKSCKGSVWESVKKCSSLCKVAGTRDWILRVAQDLQAAKSCTHAKHAEKLKHHASWSTTGQKVQSGFSVSSWLGLATQSSREAKSLVYSVMKKWLFAFLSHSSINIPYTHEISRASGEKIERETLKKNKIDSFTIFT